MPQLPVLGKRRCCSRVREEKTAHLSHSRLWQGLQKNLSPEGAPALARRRASLHLQLALLREELHTFRWAAEASPHAHRGEAFRLSAVWEKVYAERSSLQACEDPSEQEEPVRSARSQWDWCTAKQHQERVKKAKCKRTQYSTRNETRDLTRTFPSSEGF